MEPKANMSQSRAAWRRAALGLAAFGMFAGTAFALDIGECGTPEAMTAKFKAEGQRAFASADRVARKDNLNILYGMVFTVNADRSVGYIAQSDKDSGVPATQICVYARLADLRIFDAGKPGVPEASQLRAPEADAHRRCAEAIRSKKLDAGMCGSLNSTLAKGEPKGERVMFQGFHTQKQANGSYRKDGVLVTVTGTLKRGPEAEADAPFMGLISAILFSSLPEGATTINEILVFAEYTPYGLTLLR